MGYLPNTHTIVITYQDGWRFICLVYVCSQNEHTVFTFLFILDFNHLDRLCLWVYSPASMF